MLITIVVTLSQSLLEDGQVMAAVFALTVFFLHLGFSQLCLRSRRIRHFLRGKPVLVVRNGEVLHRALSHEGLSLEELHAGLRKAGIEDITHVKSAHLEETGQVSAIKRE